MIVTVGGPPFHIDADQALHRRTLPELITFYLRALQWEREQEADRLDAVFYQLQGEAEIRGRAGRGAEPFLRRLADKIKELRGPMFPPDMAPAEQVFSDDVLLMMRGRAALDRERGNHAET